MKRSLYRRLEPAQSRNTRTKERSKGMRKKGFVRGAIVLLAIAVILGLALSGCSKKEAAAEKRKKKTKATPRKTQKKSKSTVRVKKAKKTSGKAA